MIPPFHCEHGRQCVECPNKMLKAISDLLKEAAQIFNDVHESFDGITVKHVVTWAGNAEARIKWCEHEEIEKKHVELKSFYKVAMICPKCLRLYPKLRLPLLTVCVECTHDNI